MKRLRSEPPCRQTCNPLSAFVWIAGRPALDLCNTRLGGREYLESPDDLALWLRESGLAIEDVDVCRSELRGVLALRESLRVAILKGDRPAVASLAAGWLNGVSGRLCVEEDTLRPRFRPAAATCRCTMVRVVLDALELVRDTPGLVRECADDRCEVLYLDTSRNRSRRWCSMQRCGARAKATAYYRRHRGEVA